MRTSIRTKALAGLATAVLTLGLAACTGNDEPPTPPTVEPAPVEEGSDNGGDEQPTEDTSAAGACTLPEGDQALPPEAPEVDEWTNIRGMGIPISEEYGPQHREGDLYSCYAHSPTGALFASVYVYAASGYVEGFADTWIKDGEIPGAEESEGQDQEVEAISTLQGYRFVAADNEQVTLDLALEIAVPDGTSLQSFRVVLKWEEDRWYLDPQMVPLKFSTLSSMDGYTPWSANG